MNILKNNRLILEPFSEGIVQELQIAANDPSIWQFTLTRADGANFDQWFSVAMQKMRLNMQMPFIVRECSSGKVIGSTRFSQINQEHQHCEIGNTFYLPAYWGSYVNPLVKFMMLEFAFEQLMMQRVEFRTDSLNKRSQAAISKLGAKLDGVLRQQAKRIDGSFRDSFVFSILRNEWPAVKHNLQQRLSTL